MERSRRRMVGRVLLVLCFLVATAASAHVVFSNESHDALGRLKVPAILLAVAVLGLELLWVLLFFRDMFRGEGTQYLLSRTAEGTARISLRAIQASLLRRARDLDEVIGAKVAVRRPAEKHLRVDVSYTTTEDRNAILVSESLRKSLRERFDEIVHPEEGFRVEFDVKIEGFVPSPAAPREKSEESREESEPFTGPRYPID